MNIKSLLIRLLCCLAGWGTVGIVYHSTGQFTGNAALLAPSFIDSLFHFSADALWFYLSFFLFIPVGYLFCPLPRVRSLMYMMQLCALASGVIYFIYPTTMEYPTFTEVSLSTQILTTLISIDSPQNLLPSLHVSLTLVVLKALWSTQRKCLTALYLIWAIAICVSVLILKRHLFIDVVTGALMALVAILTIQFIQHHIGKSPHE